MTEITEDKLSKAVDNLMKSTTVTTKVEGMAGETGSTQVFHTPSNSDPGSWAGSKPEDVPGNGPGVNKIGENGTDLRMMKSILAKLAKGLDLSDDEKKVVAKAMKDDEHDDEAKDKQLIRQMVPGAKDEKVAKSLLDAAQETPSMAQGLEMSAFLRDQTVALSKSLEGIEARLTAHIDSRLAAMRSEYETVAKSMTSMLSDVGVAAAATVQKVKALEAAPARAPKSEAINKSLAGGIPAGGEPLTKSLVESTLEAMVYAKEIAPFEAVRFASTGELSRELETKVRARINSGR